MNLTLIKDFFTCQANVQDLRIKKIKNFLSSYSRIGIFSLFKQLSMGIVSQLNAIHLKKYLTQFSTNLQLVQPHQINQLFSSKSCYGSLKIPSEDEIIQKGINLFLSVWGNNFKEFSFKEFSIFMKGQQCIPQNAAQVVPYPVKKKLYQIIQSQIQGLLNIQTLRQICQKQYKNIADLYQTLASKDTHVIDKSTLRNLYLMHSERMDQQFYEKIQKRLKFPMRFQQFLNFFKKNQSQINTKVKQRKIYFSSVKRKKDDIDFISVDDNESVKQSRAQLSFNTPKNNKIENNRCMTSTKLTKGDKIKDVNMISYSVNRFKSQYSQDQHILYAQPKQIQILGEILAIQESFIQLKRNLCYRKDFDLQLIYQRQGYKFQSLLNQLYGVCNFTSFTRFLVPQDFQHKYLAFVKYQKSNILTNQTLQMIDELLEAKDRKQMQIEALWGKIDKQMIFRMYCNPCDKGIKGEQLTKYFTQRECKVLLDRMDPLKTGEIVFQNFK